MSFIISTAVTDTQELLAIGAVTQTGSISVGNNFDPAIIMEGTSQLLVAGGVFAFDNAIAAVASTFTSDSLLMTVTETGVIYGGRGGFVHNGTYLRVSIENAGQISSTRETFLLRSEIVTMVNSGTITALLRDAVLLNAASTVEIRNSGTISGEFGAINTLGLAAIKVTSTGESQALNIQNSGTLVGNVAIDAASVAGSQNIINSGLITGLTDAMLLGDGFTNVQNAGTIIGNVFLAGGDDVYNGTLGQTQGIVFGGAGFDSMTGGALNDHLVGGDDFDILFGGAGNDTLSGGDGFDSLFGGTGDDLLVLGEAGGEAEGGEGDDSLGGSFGDDLLKGGNGNDLFSGFIGDDTLIGGSGEDTLEGGDENDNLFGGLGNDRAEGGNGRDRINLGDGDDNGAGENNNDEIFGGKGDDVISGGQGFDTLAGGRGDDTLNGGQDADVFVFDRSGGNDRIEDYQDGDVIDVRTLGVNSANEILALGEINAEGTLFDLTSLGGGTIFVFGRQLSSFNVDGFFV